MTTVWMLGITNEIVVLTDPPVISTQGRNLSLPEFLQEIRIKRLAVGEASVDLLLQNYGHDVGIDIIQREGPVEIAIMK